MTALLPPITGVWVKLRSTEDVIRWFQHNAEQANGRPTNPNQLANAIGKSRQFVYLMLRGKREPSVRTALAIELALGAPAGSLFLPKAERRTDTKTTGRGNAGGTRR